MGLNSWNGVSRYNNSNFAEFLVVDQPGFAYPVEGTFDQFGRQLGIYAKGTLNKLQYRISVVKPFETGIDSISTPVTLEKINENFDNQNESFIDKLVFLSKIVKTPFDQIYLGYLAIISILINTITYIKTSFNSVLTLFFKKQTEIIIVWQTFN